MAFSERIKNFNHLRDYMRDFFIYGSKTRSDFQKKSSRTYDNERRRIESYFGDRIRWDYQKPGKRLFFSVDSARISENPLYRAYRSKSFTANDILLHFFLLDLLEEVPSLSAPEAADEISYRYGESFDSQTVRGKLREYAENGLCFVEKQGKTLRYGKSSVFFEKLFEDLEDARDFLSFFSEEAPFAVVGNYLLSRSRLSNEHLRFKHHYLAQTLEDVILLPLTEAMEQNRLVSLRNVSGKSGAETEITGFPVLFFTSSQTGRRYLILYSESRFRFHSFRLDYIQSVRLLGPCALAEGIRRKGREATASCWGASMSLRQKAERFSMTLEIDEEREGYLIERLLREGRGGAVTPLGPNRFRFETEVVDSNELLPWVKTFTGRIVEVAGDNLAVVKKLNRDMRELERMYGG